MIVWHLSPRTRHNSGESNGQSWFRFFHRHLCLKVMGNVFNSMTKGQALSCTISIHMNGKRALSLVFHPLNCYSLCYAIEPWEKRWSKRLNTRMYDFQYCSILTYVNLPNSGYAAPNHDGKYLLVSNLKDGIDEYQFPSLEKIQTFSYPLQYNYILHTRTLPAWNLVVVGGDNGFARVFNRISGQLVSEIHHGGKHAATLVIS